jgi:hypothetical protein
VRKSIYVKPTDLSQLCKDLILRMIKRKVLKMLESLREELKHPHEEQRRLAILQQQNHLNVHLRRDIEQKLNASL